jgi:O-antigen ligase
MTALVSPARFDRASLQRLADWLVVGVAVVLPWSTSLTGILIVAWLLAVLPTLDRAAVQREVLTPAGGLPVLLWFLGLIGMLWADVDWRTRLGGLGSFDRLLVVPLLLAQFRRSENGIRVIFGFFASEAAVLALSYILILTPGLTWRGFVPGVPIHDDVYQGSAFLICAFGALGYAAYQRQKNGVVALGYIAAALLFIGNFGVAVVSRIALFSAPVLFLLLGWKLHRWKGMLGACFVALAIGVTLWMVSPSLRARVHNSISEIESYRRSGEATSLGEHTAFFKDSLKIVWSAPIFGHGTGSIAEQFHLATMGGSGADAVVADNPHNQTLAVAIQIGAVGALVLWAMWIAHFLLFRGPSLAAWIGPVVVVENIVSSVAHSHLFDFGNGWLYLFGVGVLGGMVLRARADDDRPVPQPAAATSAACPEQAPV